MSPPIFFAKNSAQADTSNDDQLAVATDPTPPTPPSKQKIQTTLSATSGVTYSWAKTNSLVTPPSSSKTIRKIPVRSHTRSVRKKKPGFNPLIQVGTLVSRTFKTTPCSRKIGDKPVPKLYKGLVTWINPISKKIHATFENDQTMRFDLKDILPLVVKEEEDTTKEKVNLVEEQPGAHDENEVEYIGTKEVPDVEVIKVITSPEKGSIEIDLIEKSIETEFKSM